MKLKKCKYCKKTIYQKEQSINMYQKRKFCSRECSCYYMHPIMKKHKISAFYNPILKKKFASIAGKITQQRYPGIGKRNLKNAGKYAYWNGIKFASNQELYCAHKLLTIPIVGYNYQIKIGRYTFDFYPQKEDKMFQRQFVEYHNYNLYKIKYDTKKNYYKQRRKELDKYGFKDIKLIIISKLYEIDNILILNSMQNQH